MKIKKQQKGKDIQKRSKNSKKNLKNVKNRLVEVTGKPSL